jgi:hypothetical protein
VQRLVPGGGEAADGVLVGQVQGAHRDLGVTGRAGDVGGDLAGCLRAPHGQDDLRAGRGQGACGFGADAGAGPGHDRPLAGQIDPLDHLGGGGMAAERRLEKQ